MMTVLTILEAIVFALIFVLFAAFLYIGLQVLLFFKWRSCKHCHHIMDYRGLRENNNKGHYLFHCPKCGAWEEVPKEEFIRNCDRDCNPNVL